GGKAYSFSVNVKNTGESDNQTFYLKLQYKDADDETHYDTIAEGVAVSGLWTQLCNTAYTLPEGASNLKLYVETKEDTDSFYLDEAACAVGGTLIEGAGQPEYTIKGDVNADKAFDPADVIVLQKWLLTYSDAALTDWKAGDLNADGRLDAIDLTLMKHALLAP
ncbi:MAG: carbohydrate binding domain-containing protein, partial [Oscillospiraceae bacterium]|nr:carbohydrate binding domain-containing protein [Oscillospiraceae bacterium]